MSNKVNKYEENIFIVEDMDSLFAGLHNKIISSHMEWNRIDIKWNTILR